MRRTYIFMILFGPILTGCFSLPKADKERTQQVPQLMQQYRDNLQQGNVEGAIQSLNNAKIIYTSNDDLKGGKGANFRDEAQLTALIGHAEFNRGNIDEATKKWQESFEIEYAGMGAEHDVKQKNAKVVDFLVNTLSAMAAGMAAQASGSNYYTYNVQNTVVPKPEMINIGAPTGTVIRVPVRVESYPFDNVLRLRNEKGTYCTATMVAKNIAISAAHCLSEDGQAISPSKLKLTREGIFKSYDLTVKTYFTHTGEGSGWDRTHQNDWLILVTGNIHDKTGPFPKVEPKIPTPVLKGSEPVMLAGYSSDLKKGYYLTLHYGCRFKAKQAGTGYFLSNCENAKGSSGSAIMTTKPPYRVLAIHTAHIRNPVDDFSSIETFTPEFAKILSRIVSEYSIQ